MTRADLLTLLAIASESAGPKPWEPDPVTALMRPPTPDEWAAHLMAHAKALGRAVDAELDERAREEAARVERAGHDPGCVVTPAMTACEFDCPVRAKRLA